MINRSRCLLLLILSLLISSPAFADDQEIAYGLRMPYRILRGAANIVLGWPEILLRPVGEHKTEPVWEAVSKGSINTALRMGAGLTDITTFWVPDIQMEEIYPDWQTWPYLFHWS